jgi:hypothetical protein
MEFRKHRISLKLIKGEGNGLAHFFGLVRDGAAWDKIHGTRNSTDAWCMHHQGGLFGNGKICHDQADNINDGQIVSMVHGSKQTWTKARSDSGSMASLTVLEGTVG